MLRFALQRVLGGDACLQLGGGRSLGRGEFLSGVPAALLRREARGELGGGTRLPLLEAARRSGRFLVRRRLGGCREPQHVVSGTPLFGAARSRSVRCLGGARALGSGFLGLGTFLGRPRGRLVGRRPRARFARRLRRRALARTVLGLAISLRTRLGRFARRLLGHRRYLRALGKRVLGALSLGGRRRGRILGVRARRGFALGGGRRLCRFARRCGGPGVGMQPRFRRAPELVIGLRALTRETACFRLRGGAAFGGARQVLLLGLAFLGERERLRFGARALGSERRGLRLHRRALLRERLCLLLGIGAQACLLERGALGLGALARQARSFGLRGDLFLAVAEQVLFGRLLLARRVQRARFRLHPLAHCAPRLLLGCRALAHGGCRLRLRLGARAGVRRRFLFLRAALCRERGGFLLRLLASARIRRGLRLGALALRHQARRLGFGLGARVRETPQLHFRCLALTREIEAAFLLDDACARHLLGGLFLLHALGAAKLVGELAHWFLDAFLAAARASAATSTAGFFGAGAGAGAAGFGAAAGAAAAGFGAMPAAALAKSRLIMSPSWSANVSRTFCIAGS